MRAIRGASSEYEQCGETSSAAARKDEHFRGEKGGSKLGDAMRAGRRPHPPQRRDEAQKTTTRKPAFLE